MLDELIQRQLDRMVSKIGRLEQLAEAEAVRGDALWRWSVLGGAAGGAVVVVVAILVWLWVRP